MRLDCWPRCPHARMRQAHSAPASLPEDQQVDERHCPAGGALRENQAFCAHPKFDAETGRMVAFSLGLRFAEGGRHNLAAPWPGVPWNLRSVGTLLGAIQPAVMVVTVPPNVT